MTLDERKRKILESVIKDYVETAEPVGSRAVVRKHNLKISAATVRNEMADLEDMGYLEQPHTSAGRIPSEIGFRYYVDYMMETEKLDDQELEVLQRIVRDNIEDWDEVIHTIGNFLSRVTRYTSFILVPSTKLTELKYLQLVPVSEGKALLIMVTESGVLMHRTIEVPLSIEEQDLKVITALFNRELAGRKLDEIRRSDLQSIREELKKRRRVIDSALEAIDNLVDNTGSEKIMISGVLNMLNEPEFKDMDKLKKILTILEEEELLKSIIPEGNREEVDITIGKENRVDEIKEMSIVLGRYKSRGDMGKIGVIGPVRMEYWKAAGTVESLQYVIQEIFKQYFK